MKSLKTRMLLLILTPTLLFMFGLVLYISLTIHDITISEADEKFASNGELLARNVGLELERILVSVETISTSIGAKIEDRLNPSRESALKMLETLFDQHHDILSAWMYWEKDAFDGKDVEYRHAKGHDQTGQFVPVWSKNESGSLTLSPIEGYQSGDLANNIKSVLETGEASIWEPFLYEYDGEEILVTSIVVPVVINGKTVGMTGVDIALSYLHKEVNEFTFYKSGFAGILTNKGNVISHENEALIGHNFYEHVSMKDRPDLNQIIEAVKTGEFMRIEGYSDALKKDVYRLFTPITINGISEPWSAMLSAPIDEINQQAKNIMVTIITISVVIIIVITIVILMATRNIVAPIIFAANHGKELAKGNLTVNIQEKYLKRKDEVGELARSFNEVSHHLRQLIGGIHETTQQVVESAELVHTSAIQSADAATSVAMSIEEVAHHIESQMQSSEETATSMEDMAQGVLRVASASAHVSEKADDMKHEAEAGQKTVQEAIKQMEHIYHETHETKEVIERLQAGIDRIGNIVSVITDISEQTNLLALNATIEAARAGESGKGFAVVADEVRKLADETKKSAIDIQELAHMIHTYSEQATRSMTSNEAEVNLGTKKITDVGEVFEHIISFIQNVVTDIQELSALAEEMSSITEEITATSKEIASSAEKSSSHTQQVAAAAEEQLATMEEMTNTSEHLKQLAEQVEQMLKQFKI